MRRVNGYPAKKLSDKDFTLFEFVPNPGRKGHKKFKVFRFIEAIFNCHGVVGDCRNQNVIIILKFVFCISQGAAIDICYQIEDKLPVGSQLL